MICSKLLLGVFRETELVTYKRQGMKRSFQKSSPEKRKCPEFNTIFQDKQACLINKRYVWVGRFSWT